MANLCILCQDLFIKNTNKCLFIYLHSFLMTGYDNFPFISYNY